MNGPIDIPLNVLVGVPATLVILMGVRGLVPHLFRPERRDAFHLAMAMVLILAQGAGRTGYWDLVRVFTGPDLWAVVRDALGGAEANAIWNLVLLWGGLHLLKLLHLLVPVGDRHRYSMWTAWNYPTHLRGLLCHLRPRRRRK
ncbi:hypothetical protein [Oceaniglobus trochenteri]|uniref:hypothetical protein n=1 Tax=Oceaniglobus trochenteri TaxID=2763260 RepID=UPI001CFFEDA0|nr:hypothetical protein [Oceaniglobus trochenteri]